MSALETLLAAIDTMRAACDAGTTHYDGCEALHPRCAVYRAADAVKADPRADAAERGMVAFAEDVTPDNWHRVVVAAWRAIREVSNG